MATDFTVIYDLYEAAIYRYCLNKCRDPVVGQDLVQETFLRFWQCLERKREIMNARALLYRIAHNLFIDHIRRKRESSLDQLLETGFEPTIDPWQLTYSRLDAERPMKKLSAMPHAYRQVLHLRFIRGLPPAKIATITGQTPNAVSVRICRGLDHLRSLLPDTPALATKGGTRAQ